MTPPRESRRASRYLFAGLLGPAGPEVTCEECFENLDVYVAQELEGNDAEAFAPGMRAHLDGCPACAEEYDSLRDLIASQTGGRT
jgi:hypothetical protein